MKPEELELQLAPVFAGFEPRQEYLIPLLQAVQEELGYLPPEAMRHVSEYLSVPVSKVYGVVTFYTQFYLKPQGKYKIKICQGTACHVRGAKLLSDAVHGKIGVKPGETSEDGQFSVERVACIGSCALAPAMIADDKIHGPMTPQRVEALLDALREVEGQ